MLYFKKLPKLNKGGNTEAVFGYYLEKLFRKIRKSYRKHRWQRLASFQNSFWDKYLQQIFIFLINTTGKDNIFRYY